MIELRFYRGKGDREAPQIVEQLIVNGSMARVRAKKFLDDPSEGAYYHVRERTFQIPHYEDVLPNTWITVTDSKLGLNRTAMKVISVQTQVGPSSVFDTVICQQFIDPETYE